MISCRPAFFEMKNPKNQLRGGPIYGNSLLSVIKKTLKQIGIGRILELIALRYGYFWNTKYLSLHFQFEIKDLWVLEGNKINLNSEYDHTKITKLVSEELSNIPFLNEIPIQDFYWGTHIFGSMDSEIQGNINRNIILVGPGIKNTIGLGHHSFLSLVESFNIIKNNKFSE